LSTYGTGKIWIAFALEGTVGMKRFGYALLGGLFLTLLTAMPALAQSNVGTPEEDVGPQVIVRAPGGDVVQAPGGVAFTGSEVTLWMVLAAALLAVGVAFYVLGRRRARAVAK
jgi:LPXTG-motif cell wall-anchored protein